MAMIGQSRWCCNFVLHAVQGLTVVPRSMSVPEDNYAWYQIHKHKSQCNWRGLHKLQSLVIGTNHIASIICRNEPFRHNNHLVHHLLASPTPLSVSIRNKDSVTRECHKSLTSSHGTWTFAYDKRLVFFTGALYAPWLVANPRFKNLTILMQLPITFCSHEPL